MFLRNMKIRSKLFIAFGLFIVLMMVSSGLSLFSLDRANSGMQNIITNDYPITVKANKLIDHFQDFVSTQQLMLMDEEGRWTQTSQKKLDNISQQITVLLDELDAAPLNAESKKVISGIRDVREQYLASRFRILQELQNHNRQAAMQEMMTTTVNVQQAYKEKVQALIAIEDAQMLRAGAQVESDFTANRALLIALALIGIAAGCMMGWYIVRSITRPLNEAVQFAEAIAEGDLTRNILTTQKDETGELLHALMVMKTRLLEIVQEVQNGSENISSAAAQIVAGNQDLAARTEEQASSVEQTAASMEQITATVKNTAEHTGEATKLSAGAATVVKNNGEMMNQVTQKMRVINETSNRMSDIINLIDSIAFQTNILALNAAVEAARAGEAGKGFAVVADEVRNLASKSAEASKNTAALIESSLKAVENGTKIADDTAMSLNEVVTGVQDVTGTINEISNASEAQARSISQVTQGIDQISSVIQTNSATAEESAAASEELSGQAQILKNLVSQFRLKSSGGSSFGTQAQAHESVSRPSSPVSAGVDKY